ncbi:ATP-binding protein [Nannocystis sp. ILAH1]|uniref:sensor histidine kinase n=1 Tax=Nannocystis sp. ILAH1 TaxID=2996789 RepID=UPI002270297C|nr:ATP-binding protein [Nannocystis sp. ILAH1]MCY0993259.1 ATP-binding protein [Nannocystis sp. ILAH1]
MSPRGPSDDDDAPRPGPADTPPGERAADPSRPRSADARDDFAGSSARRARDDFAGSSARGRDDLAGSAPSSDPRARPREPSRPLAPGKREPSRPLARPAGRPPSTVTPAARPESAALKSSTDAPQRSFASFARFSVPDSRPSDLSRIRMTRIGQRIVAAPRVPWWGRLESRVITALVCLGILCVGASAYLVALTVQYFEGIVGSATQKSDDAVALALPFYDGYVKARKETYRARLEAMAREVELASARGELAADDPAALRELLHELLRREADLVELQAQGPHSALAERRALLPEDEGARIWVMSGPVPLNMSSPTGPIDQGSLAAIFALDPALDRDYQSLGMIKRGLDYVTVDGNVVDRGELERAVYRAIGAASALVLMVAFIAGFLLARATTRKLSMLSDAMLRVAGGDLLARVPELGNDELGQLGAAFNGMLDELASAQRKLSYLQRVGAWQEMARRIAHEIKNPLTPIQLAAQQLREKDPGTDENFSRLLRSSVEIVEDEIESLRRMVTSFSRFAKVPEAQLEPTVVARILAEFERAYGHLTERESDVLEVMPAPPSLAILGDRQLLKQCLVNLVENAVLSQRQRGPVHVRVTARPAEGEPGFVELRVDDNGPGIEPERRERVFEPYESTRKEGTGLGLAIVKKVVLDHNGEVRVEDSELGGAAVVIRLPLHEPPG